MILRDYRVHTIDGVLAPFSIVEGGARGVDSLARQAAGELGIPVHTIHAQWQLFGRAAGPKRNQQMLDEHPDIDLCLAFHNFIGKSKGTKDMVIRALKANINVRIIECHE